MTMLEKLLEHYSLSKEDYERLIETPSVSSLPDISKNPLVEGFLAYLKDIKEKQGRVLVYGDYDVDGITSTTILVSSLRKYGISAEGYLPSRYLDGYGMTEENVEKIASKGFAAILTCDNGITAHSAISLAKKKGLTVLVLDHHERGESLPEADAILHYEMLEEIDVAISAGELSYYFSRALLGYSDPVYMMLGGLSALSDMMPMRGSNHALVKLMIKEMNERPYRKLALLGKTSTYDENDLQMEIIPKLNAVGRICKGKEINRLLSYFLDDESEKTLKIRDWINEVNENRKEITASISESLVIPEKEGIVVKADIPEGLNGLLANRLMQKYGKASCVFAPKEGKENVYVGSIRAKEGFDVLECVKSMKDIEFIAFGGHELAGGVTINSADFPSFEKQFILYSASHPFKEEKKLIPLSFEEATLDNYELIRSFAPFGSDFHAPEFLLEDIPVENLRFVKDGKYLCMYLTNGTKIFSYSVNNKTFYGYDHASFSVTFTLEEWRGKKTLCLRAAPQEGHA